MALVSRHEKVDMITNKKFPKGQINIVHQNGSDLTESETGLEVNLHWRDGKPVCAEIFGEREEHYAEIGLEFDGKDLVDYDGVFELPDEVAETLKEAGYKVLED